MDSTCPSHGVERRTVAGCAVDRGSVGFTCMNRAAAEVFILTSGPLEGLGGVERFLSYVVAGFRQSGMTVNVFHPQRCAPPFWRSVRPYNRWAWPIASAVQGYFVGRAAHDALHPGVRLILSNSGIGWFPLVGSVRQVHLYHGTYRAMADAVRSVLPYHSYLKTKWWESMVLERLSGRGKLCLCNSDQTREEIRTFFDLNGHVIWCPLDPGHFRPVNPVQCRRQLGLPDRGAIGLFVGSASPHKGVAIVRRLIDTIPGLLWLVALRGEFPPDLRTHPRVRSYPNARYELLPLLYNSADFSVCPSRYEPFGYVVAEAVACGTPVVAAPGGASRLLLASPPLSDLLVADCEDVGGFERAVGSVLQDPQLYRGAAVADARPVVEELLGIDQWWSRFREVVGLQGSGRPLG